MILVMLIMLYYFTCRPLFEFLNSKQSYTRYPQDITYIPELDDYDVFLLCLSFIACSLTSINFFEAMWSYAIRRITSVFFSLGHLKFAYFFRLFVLHLRYISLFFKELHHFFPNSPLFFHTNIIKTETAVSVWWLKCIMRIDISFEEYIHTMNKKLHQ